MKYKCATGFYLDEYNEDGFDTGGYFTIKVGSIWKVDNESTKILGDDNVRLVSGNNWIEISVLTLSEYFEEVKETE